MELVFAVLFGLVYAALVGVGCGLGVFLGAWVFFRDTPVWFTIRDSFRESVKPRGR